MTHIARTADIAACRALRRRVFIEEQGVSEADEVDDLDGEAIHLLAVAAGRPVGTAEGPRRERAGLARGCSLLPTGSCSG